MIYLRKFFVISIFLFISIWLVSCGGKIKVNFDSNGGSPVSSQIVTSLSDVVEPSPLTKSCYVFTGWYYDQGSFEKLVDFTNLEKSVLLVSRSSLTLYAGWKEGHCTISYDNNGGLLNMADQTGAPGSQITLQPNAFIKVGCSFIDWNTEADGSGISYPDQATYTFIPHGDVTLYAQWDCSITATVMIHFESNGGNQIQSLIGFSGDPVNAPTPPSHNNCYFEGWYYDDQTFLLPFIFPASFPNHSITLYARWSCCQGDVNEPVLTTGLSPVYWNASQQAITRGSPNWNDALWYNYADTSQSANTSHWANAISEDGSYWVWIPRYVYRVTADWNNQGTGRIDICFVSGTDDSTAGCPLNNQGHATDSDGTWTSHPAFTYGSHELTGFWIAKFESSANGTDIQSLPGVQTQPSTIENAFVWSQDMNHAGNIHGFQPQLTETHLTRQVEWGAVAYLTHSIYGRNMIPVAPNRSDVTYAGGGLTNFWLSDLYQSTSGNEYGVFDMSGGRPEYVTSHISGVSVSLPSCHSPYCTEYWDDFNTWIEFKGDALYETSSGNGNDSSWGQQNSIAPDQQEPWFIRGGSYELETYPGVFAYDKSDGLDGGEVGFRPVLIVLTDPDPLYSISFDSLGLSVYADTVLAGTNIQDWGSGVATNLNPNCQLVGWYDDVGMMM